MLTKENSSKPLLRWAGSKLRQLPLLSEGWIDPAERYIEPFMGSACLFFKLRPQRSILGDVNQQLVSMYNAVRDDPSEVSNALTKMPKRKDFYYRLRAKEPQSMTQSEAAARFIYLNRYCFNGLFRTNLKGCFNVPYAKTKTGKLPTSAEMLAASSILARARIVCSDFERVLMKVRPRDFVYLDPPYAVANRRVFKQYGPQCFGQNDLARLKDCIDRIDDIGATFVLSYAYCKEALTLFSGWPHRRILIQRNIAGFATHRRRAAELIFTNAPQRFGGLWT